jgi:hypothetical protein
MIRPTKPAKSMSNGGQMPSMFLETNAKIVESSETVATITKADSESSLNSLLPLLPVALGVVFMLFLVRKMSAHGKRL